MIKKIYTNMLKANSKKAASSFLDNELRFIENILSGIKSNTTVVVVGCHDGMYYENITKFHFNYIGIDPYADNNSGPHILKMSFESYAQQRKAINKDKSVFIFWFNVLSHINIDVINDCFIDGDIIINSLWGGEESDVNIRNKYYSTFDDKTNQYLAVLETAKKSNSLNELGVSFKSMNFFYNSPNFFELACV